MSDDLIPPLARAAERLRLAGTMHRTCAPVRDLIGDDDIESAYAVQHHVVALQEISGDHVVGRKLGMMARTVQNQLGVHRPTIGTLMSTMQVPDGGVVPVRRLLQPLIEAEVVFRLGEDLDAADVDADRAAARSPRCSPRSRSWTAGSRAGTSARWTRSPTTPPPACSCWPSEGRPLGDADLRTWGWSAPQRHRVVSTGPAATTARRPDPWPRLARRRGAPAGHPAARRGGGPRRRSRTDGGDPRGRLLHRA